MHKPEIVKKLGSFLQAHQILTAEQLQQRTYHIWKMDVALDVVALLLPESTEDVAAILKTCS